MLSCSLRVWVHGRSRKSCDLTACREANPSPSGGGRTVGSVFNTNEWSAIDRLAVGTQGWVMREEGEEREAETDRHTDRKRPTSG